MTAFNPRQAEEPAQLSVTEQAWAEFGGLGLIFLPYRGNFFPKVFQTEMSLVLKIPECV